MGKMVGEKMIKLLSLLKVKMSTGTTETTKEKDYIPEWCEILANQIFDSAIVGAIAWLTTFITSHDISIYGFAIGFGLTFLIKMKDYRGIK